MCPLIIQTRTQNGTLARFTSIDQQIFTVPHQQSSDDEHRANSGPGTIFFGNMESYPKSLRLLHPSYKKPLKKPASSSTRTGSRIRHWMS